MPVLAVALGVSSVALAAPRQPERVTPSLSATDGTSQVERRIVNLTARDQSVQISVYNSDGVVTGPGTLTVAAGGRTGVAIPGFVTSGADYCKFVIPGGRSAAEFRASINVFKYRYGIISALPAY